jgi:hypothetical protein
MAGGAYYGQTVLHFFICQVKIRIMGPKTHAPKVFLRARTVIFSKTKESSAALQLESWGEKVSLAACLASVSLGRSA